ncbi:hypothetical protein [Photobacterium kasasachensis]|uniref:hypothetical protein n=1 Tax=Photobacterium kasasachensis TaxID=2910240 RepID=UPI003D0EE020
MNKNVNNTYLYGDDTATVVYRDTLEQCLKIIDNFATPTQIRKLKKDLQVEGDKFDEVKYLQAACETSVAATIASCFPNTFQYEPKLNPPADVDCSFSYNGFKYNIEVKCPDYSKAHSQEAREVFNIGAFGRLDGFKGMANDLVGLFESVGKPLEVQPHMDNKLKDYLLSANNKFPANTDERELNVLLVCCDTALDLQKWFSYMHCEKGLLTAESFHQPDDYSKVDVVVLTNLYHRHYSYKKKSKITDNWSLGNSFNLVFDNRSTLREKNEAILSLVNILPNYSREVFDYHVSEIERPLLIPLFVNNELISKNIFYFDPSM